MRDVFSLMTQPIIVRSPELWTPRSLLPLTVQLVIVSLPTSCWRRLKMLGSVHRNDGITRDNQVDSIVLTGGGLPIDRRRWRLAGLQPDEEKYRYKTVFYCFHYAPFCKEL